MRTEGSVINTKESIDKKDDLVRIAPLHPSQKLHLVMSIPPSVNHMYFYRRVGRRTIPTLTIDAQKWFNQERHLITCQVEEQNWQMEELGVWLIADWDFYFQNKRIRDTHNCFKISMDVMEGVCYRNDYYVKPRVQGVYLDKSNPRVEVTLYADVYNVGRSV